MQRLWRIVYVTLSMLAASTTGCRSRTPLAMPDALRTDGLTLIPAPPSLAIQPERSGRIRFQLQDEQDQPVVDYPVEFSILDGNDGGSAGARLSTDRGLTDETGTLMLETIAGGIGTFIVQASSPGAPAATVDVLVTPNRYAVAIVPLIADDVLRSGPSIARTRLYFFDNASCRDIDLTKLRIGPTLARGPYEVAPGNAYQFSGVSGQGSAAVAAIGFDTGNALRIGGCLDLPGSLLLDDETISATVLLDRLLPSPVGTYQVASDFPLSTAPPTPVPAIQAPWQEWTRCPLDPARLWLDCTLDALVTNAPTDPNDCVPVAGGEGALGSLLEGHRGVVQAAAPAATSVTPCRDKVDALGRVSLEAALGALFDGTRSSLTNMNLGTLANEVGALLGAFHINSTIRVVADQQPNTFLVDHDLVDISFPGQTMSSPPLSVATLGLPVPSARGVAATLTAGPQLKLQPHAFTLRLGTAAHDAFEATSLRKSRGVGDASQLVNQVFSLAKLSDQNKILTGCDALDAVCCDQVKRPRGCLLDACNSGLSALAQKLHDSFSSLDGAGLDFFLSLGSAPVVDANGDGHADALGTLHTASGAAAPGLWLGVVAPGPSSYSVTGTWIASSTGGP